MTTPTTPIDATAWVDAAPFAAHLAYLSATTGVPWPVVAAYAGLSLRSAERLMSSAGAARLRRIPRTSAHQLMAVEPHHLASLRATWVNAEPTVRRVALLVGSGAPITQLAGQLGCRPDLVARLADGEAATVTADIALRARIACETADRERLQRALHAA